MTFVPSPYQQAFFDWVVNETGSTVLKAVAGSGKTTTVVESFKLIDPSLSCAYLVFNKRNQLEAQGKVPKHVRAQTFHGAGFGAYRYRFKGVQVDDKKTWAILRQYYPADVVDMYGSFVNKLVSLAKQSGFTCIVPDDHREYFGLIEHFDLWLADEDAQEAVAVDMAQRVLRASIEQTLVIDFDDMIFMPLVHNVRMWQNDWVFVDEAQDINATQRVMLKKMLKRGGRLVAVGDPAQAIYGFRGADSNSIDLIKESFGCGELPLTVSFRCPKAIVKLAQEFVPYIEAYEGAPEGTIHHTTLEEVVKNGNLTHKDTFLCRNVAPLIDTAYFLIGRDIGCTVLGREIGEGLINLIKRMKARGIEGLYKKLEAFQER